ncbi:hypothetical protein, partial [Burkholderia ubonensis]|uniref:hypothetical protein n=1 Tax=Burkholderia ubonensis TaxID=101571 RepID=UPI001E526334
GRLGNRGRDQLLERREPGYGCRWRGLCEPDPDHETERGGARRETGRNKGPDRPAHCDKAGQQNDTTGRYCPAQKLQGERKQIAILSGEARIA